MFKDIFAKIVSEKVKYLERKFLEIVKYSKI